MVGSEASDTCADQELEVPYHHFQLKEEVLRWNLTCFSDQSKTIEITYAHIEENGQWKRIDDTVKIKPASYDDDFVHGLTKGECRLAVKHRQHSLNAVIYKQF